MSKRSIMPATSTPIRLPQDIILKIIGWLEPDQILSLRRSSFVLPEWLGILMSDKELYHTLRRYRMQSHRPTLIKFEETLAVSVDLKQREKMMQQHMKGYPHGQVHVQLNNLMFCNNLHIHGAFVAFAAQDSQDGTHLFVVMHLLHQKAINIPARFRVRAITLTDTLFAFGDVECCYIGKLEELDFDGDVIPQVRSLKFGVQSLAGKHNEVAIITSISLGMPVRGVRLYDYAADSMSEPIADSAYALFWDERLWIITAEAASKLVLTFRSTRTVKVSVDRLPGVIMRITAQSTGDELQIDVSWLQPNTSLRHQTLLLRDFKIVKSFLEECTVWRGNIHESVSGGVEIKRHKRLGRLPLDHAVNQLLAINDSFLVILNLDGPGGIVNVFTMVFDRSIDLPYKVIAGKCRNRYWWQTARLG